MSMRFVYAVVALVVLVHPGISQAAVAISYTDLWDISQGSVVGSNTGALDYYVGWQSDIRNMFGGSFGSGPLAGSVTLLKDYMSPGYQGGPVPAGYTHYVEWQTPNAVTLRSFALHAHNEGMDRRAFSQFTLYSGSGAGGPWTTTIYDTGPGYTYGPGYLDIEEDVVTPVVAQYFRAEFVQASWATSTAIGPRILELDGFDTFLDGSTGVIPEPSTFAIWSLLGLSCIGVGWWRKRKAA